MNKMFIILLTGLLLSCGTDQGEGKTYNYKLINESGKTIQIKSYISYYPNVPPVITTLNDGEEIEKTYRDDLPPSEYNFKVFLGGDRQRDSLVVIYDQRKFSIFKRVGCAGSERNPLNTCIYSSAEETFIFKEEDYKNATPCNGECE